MSIKLSRIYRLVFVLILLAYAVYAVGYIYRTSFVVDGQRYFVLFDDAMISMRYAQNLAHGYGPVWNAGGERVEGFTNPLWVAFMALFHLLPILAPYISLPLQICGGLFFIASLYFVKKIAEELGPTRFYIGSALVPLLAVFITAFYGQLSTWSLLGMEVSMLMLISNAAVWLALRILKTGVFSPWLYVLLGIGTLVRLDMAVPFGAILVFLWVADPQNRRRHLLWGLGLLVAFLGGQTLLRWLYYGELLPNTYYLKVTGAPITLVLIRGLFVFVKFVWNFNPALFLLPFLVILGLAAGRGARGEGRGQRVEGQEASGVVDGARKWNEGRSTFLLAWVFAAYCAYSVYVGGDAWESKGGANRFISTGIPLFFVLFAYSLEVIRRLLVNSGQSSVNSEQVSEKSLHPLFLSQLALVGFALVGLVNFNALLDINSLRSWLLLEAHPFIAGSARYVRIARIVDEITTPEATEAVVTAGIIPYFSDRPAVDLLGKSDKHVARGPMHITPGLPLIDFRPGHMKWDYAYSLGQLKPDIVAQLYDGYDNPTTLQYLTDYTKVTIDDLPFFLKNDSPYILWDSVDQLKTP